MTIKKYPILTQASQNKAPQPPKSDHLAANNTNKPQPTPKKHPKGNETTINDLPLGRWPPKRFPATCRFEQ